MNYEAKYKQLLKDVSEMREIQKLQPIDFKNTPVRWDELSELQFKIDTHIKIMECSKTYSKINNTNVRKIQLQLP